MKVKTNYTHERKKIQSKPIQKRGFQALILVTKKLQSKGTAARRMARRLCTYYYYYVDWFNQ